MGANTIRTWGDVTPGLLQKADQYGLKVIAGFWVDCGIDFTFPGTAGAQQRQTIINAFSSYLAAYKENPSILMLTSSASILTEGENLTAGRRPTPTFFRTSRGNFRTSL